MCFDILRREKHRRGRLLDVCHVNSFAQGNILCDSAWEGGVSLLTGLQFVHKLPNGHYSGCVS